MVVTWQSKKIIPTKAVHSSAFPALFYLVSVSGGVAGGHKFSWKVYKTFDLPFLTPALIL